MGFKPSQRDDKKSVPSLMYPPEPRETQSTALRPQTEASWRSLWWPCCCLMYLLTFPLRGLFTWVFFNLPLRFFCFLPENFCRVCNGFDPRVTFGHGFWSGESQTILGV